MIFENYSLKDYNTFGVKCKAKQFAIINSEDELLELLNSGIFSDNKHFIIGGGSNVLFINDYYDGLIIKNDIEGIDIIDQDDEHYLIKCSSGVIWHDFLKICLENHWHGMENLALIPGKCGAAPVQNIGAYGVEQEQFFDHLEGYSLQTKEKLNFKKDDCNFGYRDSVFKNEFKNKFIITSIYYKLYKKFIPDLTYRDLNNSLMTDCTAKELFEKVVEIREKKLPNIDELGNAGSFFKNPIINIGALNKLKNKNQDIKFFDQGNNLFKIPAAWLIENAGWKGFREGEAGVSPNHALILVNYGNATGREIFDLSENIIESVNDIFGIKLDREVNII